LGEEEIIELDRKYLALRNKATTSRTIETLHLLLKRFRVKTHGNFAFVYIYVVLIVFQGFGCEAASPGTPSFFR